MPLTRDHWDPLITTTRWAKLLKKATWGKCAVAVCPRTSPWRCRGCQKPVCTHHVTEPRSLELTGYCPRCRPSGKTPGRV